LKSEINNKESKKPYFPSLTLVASGFLPAKNLICVSGFSFHRSFRVEEQKEHYSKKT